MEPDGQRPIRVLLLDDHELARGRLAARLAHQPLLEVVGAAAAPSETLRLAEELLPDAVLVETRRLDRHGLEAIATLSALDEEQRPAIIAYLDILHRDDWFAARDAGADDVLLKELPPEPLARELRRIVDRVRRHPARPYATHIAQNDSDRRPKSGHTETP